MRTRRTTQLAGACLMVLLSARTVTAQTFKSRVDLVALTVTVTDPQGRGIEGLTADHFAVYDEGVKQAVSLFSSRQVPLDVALVLDTSGSMSTVLPVVKRAAGKLVAKLRSGDRASVVDIKERIEIRTGLTAELVGLRNSLAALHAAGNTALYDGVYVALHEFARHRRERPELRRQALVIFSDGLDNVSHVDFDALLAFARSCDVTIYTITPHDPRLPAVIPRPDHVQQAAWEMRTLTRDTGGVAFFPVRPFDLEQAFERIASELIAQYALAYPLPLAAEGKPFRHVSIQLLPPVRGTARTRAGYVPRPGSGASPSTGAR